MIHKLAPDEYKKKYHRYLLRSYVEDSRKATEERYRNMGAYIVLEPPTFDTPIFHSFEAVSPRPKVNPYYDFEDVIDSDEELDLVGMEPHSGVKQP
ncbi:Serine/threonine-protein phosphatase 7 [Orobanche gracilis]